MNDGRRFGAEGMRRGARVSQVAAAAPAAVTLDDIYARHTWSWWWDGAHGVNAGAGTWTDRVASYVLTASGLTLTNASLSGSAAVRATGVAGSYLDGAAAQVRPSRVFVVAASESLAGASDSALWQQYDDVVGMSLRARATGGSMAWVSEDFAAYSDRAGADWDDGSPRVVRHEYNATHASHVLRLNGADYSAAVGTTDAVLDDASAGSVFGAYSVDTAIDATIVAAFACAYATIDSTEAAQVETDLLTIMGL